MIERILIKNGLENPKIYSWGGKDFFRFERKREFFFKLLFESKEKPQIITIFHLNMELSHFFFREIKNNILLGL